MKIKHVYGNVLKLDIPLTIKIRTIEGGVPTEREEPFYPDISKGCTVILGSGLQYNATVSGNVAHIEDDGIIDIGTYKVTVKCYDEEGNPYRYMVRDIIEICEATIEAGIEAGVEFNAETYTLDGAVFIAYGEQVQADWEEDDETSKAFIKNKPEIPVVPTNVSAFNNDVGYLTQHQDISGKEDTANKVTSWQSTPDDTHYPSEKLVKESIDGVDKLVEVEYGVATFAQVKALVDDGKIPYFYKDVSNEIREVKFVYSAYINTSYAPDHSIRFSAPMVIATSNTAHCYKILLLYDNTWTDISDNPPQIAYSRVNTIAGNESSTGFYPSTKAVADYAEKKTDIVAPVNTTDATLPITTLSCEVGKYYRIDVAVDTLAITLPAVTDTTHISNIVFMLTTGSTPAVTFTAPSGINVYYQDGFEIEADSTYEINALFNGAAWVVAAVKINVE